MALGWLAVGSIISKANPGHVETIVKTPAVQHMVDQSWQDRASINEAYSEKSSSPVTTGGPATPPSQILAIAPQIQSEPLRRLLGLEGGGTYSERMKGLSQLKKPLAPSDLQWLYGFLASSEKIDGLSDPAEHALKDGIMVFLMSDSQNIQQTVEILRQIYLDGSQDATIRTYAVQYMADSLSLLADGPQRTAIQQLVVNLANSPTQVGSGAALLGLERTTNEQTIGLTPDQVDQMALNVASNNQIPEMERMHPLQVCGQRGIEEAAPIARDLAVNGDHAMVRMAALATLGELGQASDLPLLTQASNDPDERIRAAASAALATLQSRLNQ